MAAWRGLHIALLFTFVIHFITASDIESSLGKVIFNKFFERKTEIRDVAPEKSAQEPMPYPLSTCMDLLFKKGILESIDQNYVQTTYFQQEEIISYQMTAGIRVSGDCDEETKDSLESMDGMSLDSAIQKFRKKRQTDAPTTADPTTAAPTTAAATTVAATTAAPTTAAPTTAAPTTAAATTAAPTAATTAATTAAPTTAATTAAATTAAQTTAAPTTAAATTAAPTTAAATTAATTTAAPTTAAATTTAAPTTAATTTAASTTAASTTAAATTQAPGVGSGSIILGLTLGAVGLFAMAMCIALGLIRRGQHIARFGRLGSPPLVHSRLPYGFGNHQAPPGYGQPRLTPQTWEPPRFGSQLTGPPFVPSFAVPARRMSFY